VVEPAIGDIDGDGSTTITDALAIKRRTGSKIQRRFLEAADANCDSVISANDAWL